MKWLKSNIVTILLMALLSICGVIGTIYVQKLGASEIRIISNGAKILAIQLAFAETKQEVKNLRWLSDERYSNIVKEIEKISERLIERMDQQHEFLKGLINR